MRKVENHTKAEIIKMLRATQEKLKTAIEERDECEKDKYRLEKVVKELRRENDNCRNSLTNSEKNLSRALGYIDRINEERNIELSKEATSEDGYGGKLICKLGPEIK